MIEIVTSKTCRYCGMAKEFFHVHGLPFREIDAASEEGAKKLAAVNSRTVPTLFIHRQPITGFHIHEIRRILGLK